MSSVGPLENPNMQHHALHRLYVLQLYSWPSTDSTCLSSTQGSWRHRRRRRLRRNPVIDVLWNERPGSCDPGRLWRSLNCCWRMTKLHALQTAPRGDLVARRPAGCRRSRTEEKVVAGRRPE
ncbi:unnamed protein product [Boreogadus saida]